MQLHKQQVKKLKEDFKKLKSKAKGAERKKVEADFIMQEKEMIERHQQELSKFEGDSLPEEIQPEDKKPAGISKAQKKRLKKEEEERARDIERENCVNEARDLENERISSILESLGLSIFPVISIPDSIRWQLSFSCSFSSAPTENLSKPYSYFNTFRNSELHLISYCRFSAFSAGG